MRKRPFLPYQEIEFTRHAVQQMFKRTISNQDVVNIIKKGEVIRTYLDDKPYPSYLIFHYINSRPLHIVIAYNKSQQTIIVITAYEPSVEIWNDDFKTKK